MQGLDAICDVKIARVSQDLASLLMRLHDKAVAFWQPCELLKRGRLTIEGSALDHAR